MRYALRSVIVAGAVDDYRRAHVRVPDDLRALFDVVGIQEWVIWRSGHDLFHLVECDDLGAAMAVMDVHPANVAWQANIGRFVVGFLGPDGGSAFAPLEQVWALSEQRGGVG